MYLYACIRCLSVLMYICMYVYTYRLILSLTHSLSLSLSLSGFRCQGGQCADTHGATFRQVTNYIENFFYLFRNRGLFLFFRICPRSHLQALATSTQKNARAAKHTLHKINAH
jgi:hypothetical protein